MRSMDSISFPLCLREQKSGSGLLVKFCNFGGCKVLWLNNLDFFFIQFFFLDEQIIYEKLKFSNKFK